MPYEKSNKQIQDSAFKMKASKYGGPMQKNFGKHLAINKKLDKDSMSGGLTGQPGKELDGPMAKKFRLFKKPTAEQQAKRNKLKSDVKNFGGGIKKAVNSVNEKVQKTAKNIASNAKVDLNKFASNIGLKKTNLNKKRAEKAKRKAGESQYQANIRIRKEKRKAKKDANKADAAYYGSAKDKAKNSKANRIKVDPPKTKVDPPKTKTTFKNAFATARKAGKKTFSWNSKKYTTELAKTKKKK